MGPIAAAVTKAVEYDADAQWYSFFGCDTALERTHSRNAWRTNWCDDAAMRVCVRYPLVAKDRNATVRAEAQ